MRGTFANVRLRNKLAPGTEGGVTVKDGEQTTIYEAAMDYAEEGVPLCVLAGKEYGSGSLARLGGQGAAAARRALRDRRVVRAHPPLEPGRAWGSCRSSSRTASRWSHSGSTGQETFDLAPLEDGSPDTGRHGADGVEFEARVRIDTPNEWLYYRHGGILHFVLRRFSRAASEPVSRTGSLFGARSPKSRPSGVERRVAACGASGSPTTTSASAAARRTSSASSSRSSAGPAGGVAGRFFVKQDHQGPPGFAHGGVIAAALDEAMSLLLHGQGTFALTGRLEIDLRAPAPVGSFVAVEADVERVEGRRLQVTARALGEDGVELGSARGVFVETSAGDPR